MEYYLLRGEWTHLAIERDSAGYFDFGEDAVSRTRDSIVSSLASIGVRTWRSAPRNRSRAGGDRSPADQRVANGGSVHHDSADDSQRRASVRAACHLHAQTVYRCSGFWRACVPTIPAHREWQTICLRDEMEGFPPVPCRSLPGRSPMRPPCARCCAPR